MKNTANIITACRIVLSVIMLFYSVFTPAFYAVYILAGITDMIDGTIARKLGAESAFGAKLDTVADIVFFAAAAYKLLPVLHDLPLYILIWVGVIALIKTVNIVSGFVVQKKFVSVHTLANKVTGLLLFMLPLTMKVVDIQYSAIPVCVLATFAAIQEGHLIRTGN